MRGLPAFLPAIRAWRSLHRRCMRLPTVHRHIQREAGAEDIFPQEAVFIGVGDGFDPAFNTQEKLPADVDISAARSDRIAGNDDAFDDLVRIALDDLPVLEGTRLAFIGVNRHNLLDLGVFRHKPPFYARGKACAASAT